MKMTKSLFPLLLMSVAIVSCGQSGSKHQAGQQQTEQQMKDSIARAAKDSLLNVQRKDSINKAEEAKKQQAAAMDKQAETIIRKIFRYVTSTSPEMEDAGDRYIESHCSKSMVAKLRRDYDMDGYGLATWDFRSGAQDGDGPSRIKSVKSLGDGWYRYDFLDMGVPGAKKVHITTTDTNDIVIDKLITIK